MKNKAVNYELIPINEIHVVERIRKDNGDLDSLASDIRKNGLINPITVMRRDEGGYVLVAGLRRLLAVEKLGEVNIRATVMSPMAADEALKVEISENEERKNFTPSERLAYAERLKEVESQKAQLRIRAGRALSDLSGDTGKYGEKGRVCDIVARKVGFTSSTQMRRVAKIAENRPDLLAALDRGEYTIHGAYVQMKNDALPRATHVNDASANDVKQNASSEASVEADAIKGADHARLMENPIYRDLFERYGKTVSLLENVRDELRERTKEYERIISSYKANLEILQRENISLWDSIVG